MNRLMIVDDALIMRMKIKEIASSVGWDIVAEAGDGEQAVELYEEHSPDLVTLDMVMPKRDGVSTLREIRLRDEDAHVVMVSAVNQKDRLHECIEAGALDFIVKPFDPDRLRALFRRYYRA